MKRYILIIISLMCFGCTTQDAHLFQKEKKDNDYKIIKAVQPIYPSYARENFIEGKVGLQYTVGADGKAHEISLVDGYSNPIFNDAAVEALKKYKFRPRTENGKDVDVPGRKILIRFTINQNEVKAGCNNLKTIIPESSCTKIK